MDLFDKLKLFIWMPSTKRSKKTKIENFGLNGFWNWATHMKCRVGKVICSAKKFELEFTQKHFTSPPVFEILEKLKIITKL